MTGERLQSDLWYRVADCRPRLRKQVEIHRHHYRGELWYVLENHTHRRSYRFTPNAYQLIALLDGASTVEEIWQRAREELGDHAPSQDDFILLLGQLHEADALSSDAIPDRDARERLRGERARKRRLHALQTPLMWRFPLFDPEPILARISPRSHRLFTPAGFLVWLSLMVVAVGVAAFRWTDLTENLSDRVLAPSNLLILFLLFPVLKVIHELGHALAVKAFGGEVREMGIMLLILSPIPYVDASAASAFPRKRERVVVGAAGMMFETFIAASALILWAVVDPGLLRGLLFNIVLIGSFATIVFNANPFLRFDGYAILADLIEIPNLANRGKAYLRYLGERYVLRNKRVRRPKATRSERNWLVGHGLGSIVCRIIVLTNIVLFIAGKFFALGVLLALWAVTAWVALPVLRGVRYLLRSPSLEAIRGRAITLSVGSVGLVLVLLCLLPVPLRSRAEGVVWVPDQAVVRAATDGFIVRLLAEPGSRVRTGQKLFECSDPRLATTARTIEAELDEFQARRDSSWLTDRVQAEMLDAEIRRLQHELETERDKIRSLTVVSPCDGTLVVPQAADLAGRFVRKGQSIAHVLSPSDVTARVVVLQEHADLVRTQVRGTRVRLSEDPGRVVVAEIRREVPEASHRLPSAALGVRGGGRIPIDPADPDGLSSLEKLFQFDVHFPTRGSLPHVGGRVLVRFDHGWQPLAARWYQGAKRLWEETRG